MFDGILQRMREKIHAGRYVMALHAEEEMDQDRLTVFDVECAILTGEIVERQRDRTTGEWKYLVKGKSLAEERIVVVAKLSLTGKLFIITVYLE